MATHRCSRTLHFVVLISLLCPNNVRANIGKALQKAQNIFNLSGKIVPRTSLPAYERMASCPAFAVTTPWGSPYMIFDRLTPTEAARDQSHFDYFTGSDRDEQIQSSYKEKIREHNSLTDEEVAQQAEMEYESAQQAFSSRTTALYFTDPEDAQHLVDEMKQMGNGMDRADIRVMATSMGRAVRQASRLGHGLPTGQPVDEMTGRLDNSAIRYKIVPSKRELFYAATRCMGKERVGLFGDSREEDARSIILSPRELAESRSNPAAALQKKKTESVVKRQWRHMKGKTGIPVFYADGMKRKVGRGVNKEEIPLFLSYEDLRTSWNQMRNNSPDKDQLPDQPPMVEVYNFMDVAVAIEKNQWQHRANVNKALNKISSNPFVQKLLPTQLVAAFNNIPKLGEDDIDKLVFIPSSRALKFKENTSKCGNGKARLRPMR